MEKLIIDEKKHLGKEYISKDRVTGKRFCLMFPEGGVCQQQVTIIIIMFLQVMTCDSII